MLFIGCQRESEIESSVTDLFSLSENDAPIRFMNQYNEGKSGDYENFKLIKGGWYIKCSGSCDCYYIGDLNTGTVKCSCTQCAMSIIWNDKFDTPQEVNNKDQMINYFSKNYDFTKIILEEFKNRGLKGKVVIKDLKHYFYEENRMSFVEYYENENLKSFLVYSNYTDGGSRYVVDCYGLCDCLEEFNPQTGVVSCTCSPCKMSVVNIDKE